MIDAKTPEMQACFSQVRCHRAMFFYYLVTSAGHVKKMASKTGVDF